MAANPYQPPHATPTARRTSIGARIAALVVSAVSGGIGCFFAWYVLVIYAFSTMVDPRIGERERTRLIIGRFLFGDGPGQFVFITVFILFATGGVVFCLVFLSSAVVGRPSLRLSAILSGAGALLITSIVVGGLVFLAA